MTTRRSTLATLSHAFLLALGFWLLGAGAAGAQAPGGGMGGGACRDDATRLCADAPRGGGGMANCLHDHMDDLSQGCREMMAGRENVKTACQADIDSLCKDAGDRPMLRLRCLNQNRDKLSAGCRAALDDFHPMP